MKKINTKKDIYRKARAFTLMEVLIAASIFAIVMVITTGVLGQSSSFRTQIKASRETSEDVKKISDMITRDVKKAKYSIKANAKSNSLPFESNRGIMLAKLNLSISSIDGIIIRHSSSPFDEYPTSDMIDSNYADVLVIADEKDYLIYVNYNNNIYYKSIPRLKEDGDVVSIAKDHVSGVETETSFTKINNQNTAITLRMAGFAPENVGSNKSQPYVQFYLQSETKGYDSLSPRNRAKTEIRSSVTVRNYNN